MALIKFGNNTDFNNFEARNIHIEAVATLPTASDANNGRVVYHTKTGRFYICNGTSWVLPATDSDQFQGNNPAYYLNRANHTGTQLASTISDFASVVKGYRISDFSAAASTVDFGGNKLSNLGQGTVASDAVNKGQLDQVAAVANSAALGVSIKEPVKITAVTQVPLSGTASIQGVPISAGDRVLVAGQTSTVENGIYVVATGSWSRAKDADESGELKPGTMVAEYTTDTIWTLTTVGTIVPGTSSQTWTKFISSPPMNAGEGIKIGNNTTSIDTSVVPKKVIVDIPAGQASVNITHNLNTQYLTYQVYEKNTNVAVIVDFTATSPNTGTIDFGVAPTSGQYIAIFVG